MRPIHEYWCKCTWRTNGINKTATSDWRPPLTVGLPVTSERYWASFQVTRLFHKVTVSQCDHFFFAATYVFVWNFTRLITRLKSFFILDLVGGSLSSNVFTICAVYWSLGRRGYFGVSKVALVYCSNRKAHHPHRTRYMTYRHMFNPCINVNINLLLSFHLEH